MTKNCRCKQARDEVHVAQRCREHRQWRSVELHGRQCGHLRHCGRKICDSVAADVPVNSQKFEQIKMFVIDKQTLQSRKRTNGVGKRGDARVSNRPGKVQKNMIKKSN